MKTNSFSSLFCRNEIMIQRTAIRLNSAINEFLEKRDLLQENPGWKIQESALGGFGIFATRDYRPGDVIFRDSPVIIGPRCSPEFSRICASCFSKTALKPCKNNCGLDLCLNPNCQTELHRQQCEFLRKISPKDVASNQEQDFRKTLYENYTPLTSLFLNESDKEVIRCLVAHDRDRHGHEIDTLKSCGFQFDENEEKFLRFVCCVMDANAFEVTVGSNESQTSVRGLYPLASLANHSCVPNATHVFDADRRMVATAANFIPKNSEISHSYTRLTWSTAARQLHLRRTKHFVCKCARCKDPSEFGTDLGSVRCKSCRGVVTTLNPFKAAARWRCSDCGTVIAGKDTGELFSLLGWQFWNDSDFGLIALLLSVRMYWLAKALVGNTDEFLYSDFDLIVTESKSSILKNIAPDDFPFMWKFLNGKLNDVVPENNQVAVELKFKIVWILGHRNGYKWNELPIDLLRVKETICENLLQLLEKLRCGQSKMRGLLLYELFCCKREIVNRNDKKLTMPPEIQKLLQESAAILKYDATANEEIRKIASI